MERAILIFVMIVGTTLMSLDPIDMERAILKTQQNVEEVQESLNPIDMERAILLLCLTNNYIL